MTISVESEELRQLFDAALDAVIAMRPDGLVAAWNKQAETTFGWSAEEAIGKPLASLIIPNDLRDEHRHGLARFLETGEGPVINKRIEVRALHRFGREFPVELTIIPLQEGGRLTFFAFLRDITAAKEATAQLARRALEAQLLFEASTLVAESASFEEALLGCLQRICRLSDWSIGHVYLLDKLQSELVPSQVWYADAGELAGVKRATETTRLRRGYGLPGRIWSSGKAHWIADLAKDDNFPRAPGFLREGYKSAFGFPVYVQGRLLAVLEFFSKVGKEPDEQLLQIAQSVGQQLGRAIERQQFLEHQRTLVQELSHRVGNLISLVIAIFRQSARHSASLNDLDAAFTARLQALGRATKLLVIGNWQSAQLQTLVEAALAPHCGPTGTQYQITGPPVEIVSTAVAPLTMVLHELATNAVKYGALALPGGTVHVSWSKSDQTGAPLLNLLWQERGGLKVGMPHQEGYGMTLVRQTVEKGLAGRVDVTFGETGLLLTLQVPLGSSVLG